MSFHHHHHHHHHNGEEGYSYGEAYEGERVYATQPYVGESYERFDSSYVREGEGDRRAPLPPPPQHHATNYQRNERLGELGTAAAGSFALYEGHKATTDPAHGCSKHKQEAEVAGVAALASGGYAAYEHHEKSNDYRW